MRDDRFCRSGQPGHAAFAGLLVLLVLAAGCGGTSQKVTYATPSDISRVGDVDLASTSYTVTNAVRGVACASTQRARHLPPRPLSPGEEAALLERARFVALESHPESDGLLEERRSVRQLGRSRCITVDGRGFRLAHHSTVLGRVDAVGPPQLATAPSEEAPPTPPHADARLASIGIPRRSGNLLLSSGFDHAIGPVVPAGLGTFTLGLTESLYLPLGGGPNVGLDLAAEVRWRPHDRMLLRARAVADFNIQSGFDYGPGGAVEVRLSGSFSMGTEWMPSRAGIYVRLTDPD